jgi:sec-independent protein translocase protein TatA
MPNVGPWEIILLLLLALLLFGAKRLPEIGRSMGRGMREFKDSVSGISGKDKDDDDDVPSRP